MSLESFRDRLAERRRSALFLFYISALVSAIAITLVAKVPTLRTILLALAVAGAGTAVFLMNCVHKLRTPFPASLDGP